MTEKELLNLINDMASDEHIYKEESFTNEDSPSWLAYRQAEELEDITMIPYLANLLEKTKDRETRMHIYFILGKIGTNTEERHVADILLKGLETETNKYVLEQILNALAEQRNVEEYSTIIIKFLNDDRSSIRHTAIEALNGCKNKIAEDALIQIISESTDEYDLIYASSVLSEIGSDRAIPHLINLLNHPKGDVKCTVIGTLIELGNSSLLPVFLKALQDRSVYVKGYAMLAINRHGNETAIPAVIERLKSMLKRKRKIVSDDLITGLEFLIRYKEDNKEIRDLYDWIKSRKSEVLFEEEMDWMNTHSYSENIHDKVSNQNKS
ncbi:HEAT repeat domain-containing protein [Rummeliibacillus stabekisii]|uniref:HEAT repeat domain-containing protein n=1 Tax=Rummeliibacillus stabekisii TaxID=241244 RepID=UPI002042642A|nr:HEAT repeat domain-containing protein [Rummeliibacillus stabekisii]MCM3317311.1 HEAT repeat domain-containing protein [Rummeliibacillus stabekisii]